MHDGKKHILYETKFDKETRKFTGWIIVNEDDDNQKIKSVYQYRLIFSEDYHRI